MTSDKHATGARKSIGDIAPKLAEITDDVLFGDVWERPEGWPNAMSAITKARELFAGKRGSSCVA